MPTPTMRLTALIILLAAPMRPDQPDRQQLVEYLIAHYQAPEDYVVNKFKDHDIVYLAEIHWEKQNLIFLQRLLPRLYRAGVRDLGYKRANACEQGEIDKLINAPTYDNGKALMLTFHRDPLNGAAFQEYADVFRAAWEVNHKRPKGAAPFRVIGLEYCPDWSMGTEGKPVVDLETRNRAWAGSYEVASGVTASGLMMREFVQKRRKALVYGGGWYAWTAPMLDKREAGGMVFGMTYLVRRQIGDRITTVSLCGHASRFPEINTVLDALPPKYGAIGFDLKGTPLGDFPLPEALAKQVGVKGKLTYTVEAEGVVRLNTPQEPVSLAPGFLTDKLVEDAKREGWLPKIPSVTLESLQSNVQRITSGVLAQIKRDEGAEAKQ